MSGVTIHPEGKRVCLKELAIPSYLVGALPLDSCRLRKIISEPGIGEMNSSS